MNETLARHWAAQITSDIVGPMEPSTAKLLTDRIVTALLQAYKLGKPVPEIERIANSHSFDFLRDSDDTINNPQKTS